MRIGVCGIACEKCPRRTAGQCPNGPDGCRPKANPFCAVATCALSKGQVLCFECPEFPCEVTAKGPISAGYCGYIAMKG
ncbi:MAG: DUF3795 domain-containing protein [Candidatus Aminicenantes bacterium]|nr:DUF3795 domain-containing protein [Candidatus Aminicenantes bacterium]